MRALPPLRYSGTVDGVARLSRAPRSSIFRAVLALLAVQDLIRDLAPTLDFGWVGRIYLVILLVGVPALSMLQPIDSRMELPRRRDLYLSGIVGIAVLVLLGAGALLAEGASLSDIGLFRVEPGAFVLWTLAVTAGALAGNFVISRAGVALGIEESRLTLHLMPRQGGDRLLFLVLSASAGFGEELLYHGYVVTGLADSLGSGWWAALIANLAFGVLHGYQGGIGMVRAGLMGVVLTLPVLYGVGLWPAIAAHALTNALLGLGMWRVMVGSDALLEERV